MPQHSTTEDDQRGRNKYTHNSVNSTKYELRSSGKYRFRSESPPRTKFHRGNSTKMHFCSFCFPTKANKMINQKYVKQHFNEIKKDYVNKPTSIE
jgi:hypothetical protein